MYIVYISKSVSIKAVHFRQGFLVLAHFSESHVTWPETSYVLVRHGVIMADAEMPISITHAYYFLEEG